MRLQKLKGKVLQESTREKCQNVDCVVVAQLVGSVADQYVTSDAQNLVVHCCQPVVRKYHLDFLAVEQLDRRIDHCPRNDHYQSVSHRHTPQAGWIRTNDRRRKRALLYQLS